MTGFWVFMFLMAILIPLTMIGFGSFFYKKAPSKINAVFGYRTERSMKNQDTWQFAHTFFGRLSKKLGWIMLLVAVIVMLLLIGQSIDTIGRFGGVMCIIQTLIMIASIFPTERALKQTFNEKGKRRQP